MDYPKMLYKGGQYTDWQELGADIHSKHVPSIIVKSEDEEVAAREDGFVDAADLMIVPAAVVEETAAKRRGRPPKAASDNPT